MKWEGIKASARGALADAGTAITLRRLSSVSYDPATLAATPTQADVSLVGVLDTFSPRIVDGDRIRSTDLRIFASVETVAAEGDSIILDGKTFAVLSVKVTKPGGVPVLQEIHARASP